jgi:hypothetical protein
MATIAILIDDNTAGIINVNVHWVTPIGGVAMARTWDIINSVTVK